MVLVLLDYLGLSVVCTQKARRSWDTVDILPVYLKYLDLLCAVAFIFPQCTMDFSFETRENINGELTLHSGYREVLYIVCGISKETGKELSVIWKNKSYACTPKEGLTKDLDGNPAGEALRDIAKTGPSSGYSYSRKSDSRLLFSSTAFLSTPQLQKHFLIHVTVNQQS